MTQSSFIEPDVTRVMHRGDPLPGDADGESAITRIISNARHDPNPSPTHCDHTRVAVVDPETGMEITETANTETANAEMANTEKANTEIFNEELACTVVHPGKSHSPIPFRNVGTAYVPRSSYRHPVDSTALWKPGANGFHRIATWLHQHRKRTVGLAICVLAVCVLSAASLLPHHRPEAERALSGGKKGAQPLVSRPVHSIGANKARIMKKSTLSEAVHFLTDGEYEQARAAYRFLCKQFPDNPSFALTLDILETQEKYQ